MIACVDSDYDYLLQGRTNTSRYIIENPYVMQTYAYAIENYHCYAEGLHEICVMATLNDHKLINFPEFMKLYSQIAIRCLYVCLVLPETYSVRIFTAGLLFLCKA